MRHARATADDLANFLVDVRAALEFWKELIVEGNGIEKRVGQVANIVVLVTDSEHPTLKVTGDGTFWGEDGESGFQRLKRKGFRFSNLMFLLPSFGRQTQARRYSVRSLSNYLLGGGVGKVWKTISEKDWARQQKLFAGTQIRMVASR